MKIRRITSLTALLAFAILMLTSIILYIVPQGRVAYWSNWQLWGLSKTQWGNIHINIGILFLIAILLHIYYNWKPILSYLKNPMRQLKIFTKDFNIALILTLFVALGTYLEIPPVVWLLDVSSAIKDSAAIKYGEPPYGHAELSSLQSFCSKMQLDSEKSMASLKAKGFIVDNKKQTIAEIASLNNKTPQQIYLAMQSEKTKESGIPELPDNPPPGFGNQSLADICEKYHLNSDQILNALLLENISADPAMSIREIASQNKVSPVDVFQIIKAGNGR